jgi:hypothetical protein
VNGCEIAGFGGKDPPDCNGACWPGVLAAVSSQLGLVLAVQPDELADRLKQAACEVR